MVIVTPSFLIMGTGRGSTGDPVLGFLPPTWRTLMEFLAPDFRLGNQSVGGRILCLSAFQIRWKIKTNTQKLETSYIFKY